MSELSDTQSITRGAALSANSIIRATAGMGQTRTCLTVGASSAFPSVADIRCGCAVERQTGFWEHRPVKVKRSNARALGVASARYARTAEVARLNASERTGVQGFHLFTLHSASADKAVVRGASIKMYLRFSPCHGSGEKPDLSDITRRRHYFRFGPRGDILERSLALEAKLSRRAEPTNLDRVTSLSAFHAPAGICRRLSQFLFNANELVVLRHTIGP